MPHLELILNLIFFSELFLVCLLLHTHSLLYSQLQEIAFKTLMWNYRLRLVGNIDHGLILQYQLKVVCKDEDIELFTDILNSYVFLKCFTSNRKSGTWNTY